MNKSSSRNSPVPKDSLEVLASPPHHSTPKRSVEDIASVIPTHSKSSVSVVSSPPSVASVPGKYIPLPYTFKIPKDAGSLDHGLVKCPPFYIQLDHTLAVVWSLFSKQKLEKKLGIVQLHWAQSFLKGIHGKNGDYPADVAICIDLIEDALISHYTLLAETEPLKKKKICGSCLKKSKSEVRPKNSLTVVSPSKNDINASSAKDTPILLKQLPFSINYAEMCVRNPKHCEQLFSGIEFQPSVADLTVARPTSSTLVATTNMNGASRVDMVDFLMAWRKEQVGKIQQELQRLHSIEAFIGNVDKDNFQPYIDKQQMNILVAQNADHPPSAKKSSSRTNINKRSKKSKRK